MHTLARIVAHGYTITPRAPFVVTHAASSVQVTYFDEPAEVVRAAQLHFDDGPPGSPPNNPPRVELENARELGEVLSLSVSDAPRDAVRIETSLFSCALPEGFELRSAEPPMDPGPFDLVGPNGELLFIQTPKNLPRLEQVVAPGQKIVRQSEHDIELSYEHEGEPWTQIYVLLGRHILTAQAPSSADLRAVVVAVRESLRFT